MINVKVKLYAFLREKIGKSEIELNVPKGITIFGLIEKIADQYSEDIKKFLLDKNGRLKKDFIILVNGKKIDDEKFLLENDSKIMIFPPFSGG